MRALEKNRQRRYSSASELAADVRRHLADEPVTAGSPGASYRVGKFVRRHRVTVSAAAAGLLVLVGFAATMAVLAKRIAVERDLAEQAKADLESVAAFQAEMISEVDPEQMGVWLARDLRESIAETTRARGLSEAQVAGFLESYDASMREVNLTNTALEVVEREVLGRAVATLEERFGDQPLIDARLRGTIGETYRKFGRLEAAQPQLERALEIRKRVLGDDHPDTLASMIRLADLYRNQGRYDEAEPLYLEALEGQKRVLEDDHPHTLASLGNLAILYEDEGRYDEAERLYLETLETKKRVQCVLAGRSHRPAAVPGGPPRARAGLFACGADRQDLHGGAHDPCRPRLPREHLALDGGRVRAGRRCRRAGPAPHRRRPLRRVP